MEDARALIGLSNTSRMLPRRAVHDVFQANVYDKGSYLKCIIHMHSLLQQRPRLGNTVYNISNVTRYQFHSNISVVPVYKWIYISLPVPRLRGEHEHVQYHSGVSLY